MKNLLVTGAAGFIGSNYVHFTANKYPSYKIVCIDKLSPYSNLENIQDLIDAERVVFEKVDITDEDALNEIYSKYKFNYVVNFAAESHNDRAISAPTDFMKANALGAQLLLETSRKHDVERHVHISTIEVYGEQGQDIPYFTEASPLNAKTPYSAAKAAGDIITRAYMQTYRDMDIALTHCANNYGPYQFPEKLIPLAITNVLRGKKIALYGDGSQKRDWLHVLDHCRGIDLVLHRDKKKIDFEKAAVHPELLPIFDFSARQELQNKEIISTILDKMGYDFDKTVEFVADRPNHDRRYLINPDKAEEELGFKPEIDFKKGIGETVQWYLDNRQWWESIISENKKLQIDWNQA